MTHIDPMTFACAASMACAVWWGVRPPPAWSLARLDPAPTARRVRRRHRTMVLFVLATAGSGIVGAAVAGGGGAVVALAVGIVFGTAVRLLRRRQVGRRAAASRTGVAHACRVMAGQLRVGRIPADALRVAAEDCPVLVSSAAIAAAGGDPVPSWREAAELPGQGGLLVLARAWQVSTRTGAPLARSLERVSEALGDDLALERLVAGEVSAARATGKIMAALPLCGIALGYVIGGHPLQFLVQGPIGWVCLLTGVVLAAMGVVWIDWLSRSVVDRQAMQ